MNENSSYLGSMVIFKNNADTLPALLASIDKEFDHFSFTDTGSTDGSRALVEAFLQTHAGALTDFEWCDDFGKARQVALDASTARWRIFLDTDDVLNPPKGGLKAFFAELETRQPHVEALFVPYLYGDLEVLETMRCIRYREGWKWVDAVHERLEFHGRGALPEQAFLRTKAFSVAHKNKSPEEKKAALVRNARIAQGLLDRGGLDAKYEARLLRTVAMNLKSDGKAAEVIPLLAPVYEQYRLYPEGRQAAADIAKAHLVLAFKDAKDDTDVKTEHFEPAMEWARKAGPAYETLVHHARGEYSDALRALTRSAGRGAQTTHEGYTFERGSAYAAGARSVLALETPDAADRADRMLNAIPLDIRMSKDFEPQIEVVRDLVDRITIVVPGTPQPFDETGGGGMLGGSEEAVMYLVRALAALGRNVRVYGSLPPHRLPGPDANGVDWQPHTSFNASEEHGTLVVWRSGHFVLHLLEQKKRGVEMPGIHRTFLWLHDSGFGLQPELVDVVGQVVNGAVVLSDFHARAVTAAGYTGGMIKLANGIWEADFEPYIDAEAFGFYCTPVDAETFDINDEGDRDPCRVVYSSCPSRGLVPLLEMWPDVKAARPDAYLDIYYDWSMLEMQNPLLFQRVWGAYQAVKGLDVVHHGGVSHAELHEALRGASIWAYSHFEQVHAETFCISSIKALACGATVLTVPNGALEEVTAGDAIMCRSPVVYRQKLIELLQNPEPVDVRRAKARRAVERFGWNRSVAPRFSQLWSRRSKLVPPGSDATD